MPITYLPPETSGPALTQLAQLIMQARQRRAEQESQKRRDAQFQISTVMQHGGQLEPGEMERISKEAGMSPGYLASLSEQKITPEYGAKARVTAEEYDQMFGARGTSVSPTGSFVSKEQRELDLEEDKAQRDFERTKAQAPELTNIAVAKERAMTPVIVERAKGVAQGAKEAEFITELEYAPKVREKVAADMREQAAVVEELAAKYSGSQLRRKIDEATELGKVNFDFAKRLKAIPEAKSSMDQALIQSHVRYNNAMSAWIEGGGKDKTGAAEKYTNIINLAKAAGLVSVDKNTKLATIKDFDVGDPQLETARQLYKDNGLEFEEVLVPGVFTDSVRIVPKLPKPTQGTTKPINQNTTKPTPQNKGEIGLKSVGKTSVTLTNGQTVPINKDGTVTINGVPYKVQE